MLSDDVNPSSGQIMGFGIPSCGVSVGVVASSLTLVKSDKREINIRNLINPRLCSPKSIMYPLFVVSNWIIPLGQQLPGTCLILI